MSTVHRLPILDPAEQAADSVDEEQLLQVGDLARMCDKTVRAIHHYENLGLLQPHKRSKGRYRLYARDAVARVNWIGKLHAMGMTLSEIQQILSTWEQAPSAPEAMAKMRAVYHQKLKEVHAQIARLSSLERELHASLEYLDTCEICDPSELVAACSACTVHSCHEHEPELVAGLYAGSLSLAAAPLAAAPLAAAPLAAAPLAAAPLAAAPLAAAPLAAAPLSSDLPLTSESQDTELSDPNQAACE